LHWPAPHDGQIVGQGASVAHRVDAFFLEVSRGAIGPTLSVVLCALPSPAADPRGPRHVARAYLRLELLGQACDECPCGAAGDQVKEGLVK
jgi:hypothetical protein